MPGNELGDRVYNFFEQDNTSQGQHHPQVVEGNWPVPSNNIWVGGQGQIEVLDSNSKNYSLQNSDIDRGPGSYPLHISHGLKAAQSNPSPDLAKIQSGNDQPNLNGFMYGNQFHQTSQNEANFLSVDRGSEQHHLITSRGSAVHKLQPGGGPDHQGKALVRSEASASPGFDLFGGQQQMNDQQTSILQHLQHQQSGLSEMQQLHHQLMIGKMQEFQMQQQLQQFDLRQQNLINQVSPFAKPAPGSQSTLVNSTPISNRLQHPWTAETGTNWLNRSSATMQGSASGLGFSPNLGQTQQLMDMVPQQVDQSFYGVPVSSSRGLTESGYSHMMRDRSSPSQTPVSGNSLQRNQHNLLPGHVGAQDGSSLPRQKFRNEYMPNNASSHSVNTGTRNIGGLQQVNFMPRDAHQQDLLRRQELAVRPETLPENPTRQVASSRDEIALDPTEEKILFGSDDNLWAGFDKMPGMSGEAGNSFNHGGLSNGLPSIQSGSWSALMQSAVSETSGNDVMPQEEWSGLIFNNNDGPSANQHPSVHNNSGQKEATLVDNNVRMPSGLSSGSIPPYNGMNSNNVMELNQTEQKYESGERRQTEMSKQLMQSVEEASKWSNCSPLQRSVVEGSRVHRNASHHPPEAERNTKSISTSCPPGQSITRQQPNTLNVISPGADRVLNNHEAEKLPRNFQNNQLRAMQGEVHGSSLWRSSSIPSSSTELGPPRSTVGGTLADKGILSLNDASSASISSNVRVGYDTNPFVQNNYLLNHWKDANASAKYQGGESLGRMLHQVNEPNQVLDSMNNSDKEEFVRREMDCSDLNENSSDSHRSNLSQHISGGFRQSGLSDASESRPLPTEKQKSSDQPGRKASVSRKFQFHPMGNLDEVAEPNYGLKQPANLQPMSPQNAQYSHPNIFGQVRGKSTSMEKGQASELQRENRGSEEGPSRVVVHDHEPNMSVPLFDAYTSNKTSSSSQNMLELLHKVDQSRDNGAMMQFSSSECKASSERPEAEKIEGVGSFQRNQSFVSRGFGLQLGPPSQRQQIRDHPLNAQTPVMSLHTTSHAAAAMGNMGQQMVQQSSVQSLPFANEERQVAADSGHAGNENFPYKTPGNFPSESGSGIPFSKSNLKSQQIKRVSGQIPMNRQIDSSSENASCSTRRGSTANILKDASVSTQQDNLSSSGGMSQERTPNDTLERVPASSPTRDHMQASQNFTMPGISRQGDSSQMLHNMMSNVPIDQHRAHFVKVSSHYPESFQPNIVESSSTLLTYKSHGEKQKLNESSSQPVASAITDPVPNMKESLGKASSSKNYLDDSPAKSAAMEKDIEAFGRSLKPNNIFHQNYSLLNQFQDSKDAESNPSNRVSKRMKATDNIFDVHQMALQPRQHNDHNSVVGDSLGSRTGVASDNSRMLSISEPANNSLRNNSQHGIIPSQDVLVPGQNVSLSKYSSDYTTYVRNGHPEVSPQMAPSWFNQYGTFKNGKMLPMYDSRKVTPLRPGALPFTLGKPFSCLDTVTSEDKGAAAAAGACQNGNIHDNSIPSSVANQESSSQSSLLNVACQPMVVLRAKKRRSATSELHPWHKDILDGTENCWTPSVAEADWSKAAIRLAEKLEDDAELIEDGPPIIRSKRRLILTRQLMQQLLRSAPAAILSADASLNYESVAYSVSRTVLGDVFIMLSSSSNLDMPSEDINVASSKGKLKERTGDQRNAEVIEDLMERARKLENYLSRLDKSASILDLKVESQDLEKFSVINRFARFHGRGQTDSAEATPTDMAAATQRPVPQRYVTALPIPRSLPDRGCAPCIL